MPPMRRIEDAPKLTKQVARLDCRPLLRPGLAVRDARAKGECCLAGVSVHCHGFAFVGCCRFNSVPDIPLPQNVN